MSDDLLARATRALRESADDDVAPPPVLETRHRVLATLRRKRSNRVVWLRRVLPIAAVLVTSSAWAAANGHLGGTMRQVAAYVGLADEAAAPPASAQRGLAPPPSVASVTPVAPLASTSAAPEPAEAPAVTEPSVGTDVLPPPPRDPEARIERQVVDRSAPVAQSSAPAQLPSVSPRAVSSTRAEPASPAPRAASSADDPAQALYATAHQKHFAERDYGGALAAWDQYLRAARAGRFATEAHYNRAICLVRLGRNAEAKPALRVFADGGYGGYRQAEAKALLEALPDP